ncbi:MAG: transposase [Hyphomicrobiaceae bacterium]
MRQMTFAAVGAGFEGYAKTTRRAAFLAEMDKIVPWAELRASIEPYYPKAGNGRPPIPLERMLRIHFLQHWFNLSDPAAEEALYESPAMRAFAACDRRAQARVRLRQGTLSRARQECLPSARRLRPANLFMVRRRLLRLAAP